MSYCNTQPITQRPQNQSKRLTTAEKMMIRADVESGMTHAAVAHKYGVSKQTVQAAKTDGRLSQRAIEVNRVKTALADDMLLVASDCVTQVRDTIKDTKARDAAVCAAIMIDKSRLMSGETTQNVGIMGIFSMVSDVPIDETSK